MVIRFKNNFWQLKQMVRHKYDKLSSLFSKAYPGKKVLDVQAMLNKEWSKVKRDQGLYEALINKLKGRIKSQENRMDNI